MSSPKVNALARSWPLRSALAYDRATTHLARSLPGELEDTAACLQREFTDHARLLARGESLAQLRDVCEQAWFDGRRCDLTVPAYLMLLASHHLRPRGAALELCEHPATDYALDWRLLSLYLPADILVAAAWAEHRLEPASEQVSLGSPELRSLLREPVAETHLHLGAALEFGVLWTALQHALAGRELSAAEVDELAPPLGSGERWLRHLRCAALVRLCLSAYLWERRVRGAKEAPSFEQFIWQGLKRALPDEREHRLIVQPVQGALCELLGWRQRWTSFEYARALRLLWGELYRPHFRSADELLTADPVAQWLPVEDGGAWPETRLLGRCFLHTQNESDPLFEQAFCQYLRVRTMAHAHLVETPGTAGLDWFQRHYLRLAWYRQSLEPMTLQHTTVCTSQDVRLAALEVRVSPGRHWSEIRSLCRGLAESHRQTSPNGERELGLVLHFLKSNRDRRGREHSAPVGLVYAARHGRWIADAEQRARAVATALEVHPELLLILRGFDVASAELAQPTWALLSPLQIVRSAAERATRTLARVCPDWGVQTPRMTLHLGEEYRTPIEGLRRIHEAIACGLLERGDRIGHGLVLGCDVDRWFTTRPVLVQPRGERLDDLLWLYASQTQEGLALPATYIHALRAEAEQLGRLIYGPALPGGAPRLEELIEARAHRHRLDVLRGFFELPRFRWPTPWPDDPALAIAALELGDESTYARARQTLRVRTDEVEVIRLAQAWMVERVAKLGLTIESNPSSNLLIADLDRLRTHPLWAREHGAASTRLAVSVNSDDPLTFATRLAHEYAYLERALLASGLPSREVIACLEEARRAGWQSRFTLRASAYHENLQIVTGNRAACS